MDVYIHSLLHLHGLVPNELTTRMLHCHKLLHHLLFACVPLFKIYSLNLNNIAKTFSSNVLDFPFQLSTYLEYGHNFERPFLPHYKVVIPYDRRELC
jgi:hypothetical protein